MRPRAIDQNLFWAFAFAAGLQIFLALALGLFAFYLPRKATVWFSIAGLLIASILGLWDEYLYRVVLALCLLAALLDTPFSLAMCAIAGLLAGVLVFIKVNLAISAVLFVAVWTVMTLWLLHPSRPVVRTAVVLGCFSLVLSGGIFVFFGDFAYFGRWVRLSMECAAGYGAALSQAGPLFEAVVGVLLLASLLTSVMAVLLFTRSQLRSPLLLFALPAATALKHGFVVNTSMASGYFTFLVAIASILFLYVASRKEAAVLTTAFMH